MDWLSASEVVIGAACKHKFNPEERNVLKISPTVLRPKILYPPYDDLLKDLQDNKTPEDVVANHLHAYQASKAAVEMLNGAGEVADWLVILEEAASKHVASQHLKRVADKLERGDEVDWAKINSIMAGAQVRENVDLFTPLSAVDRSVIPFRPTGYKPIDEHLLGVPEVGITLLFGPKKSGKTSLALQIAGNFVKANKKKNAIFFSMEMLASYLASRTDQLVKLNDEQQSRFLIRDLMETPEEVVNRAATVDDLGLMVVDFADLLIRGETTESAMGHVYRTLAIGAKQLRVPCILLAHPNRSYQGGMPRPEQVRWTGLASNLSEMILATYNPAQNVSYQYTGDDDKILRPYPGFSYLIAWEIRSGFRVHTNDNPGAIRIPWQGKKGWHPKKSNWFQIKE